MQVKTHLGTIQIIRDTLGGCVGVWVGVRGGGSTKCHVNFFAFKSLIYVCSMYDFYLYKQVFARNYVTL